MMLCYLYLTMDCFVGDTKMHQVEKKKHVTLLCRVLASRNNQKLISN